MSALRLYPVTISTIALVAASSELDAISKARDEHYEIIRDTTDLDYECGNAIVRGDILPDDWSDDCLVYGVDGDVYVKQVLDGAVQP